MNQDLLIAWKMQTSQKWSDVNDILKYINIDFIDYDHQKLVEFGLKLNHVLDKAENEFSLELINETEDLLQKLYEYAVYHFKREETFMKKYKLPNFEIHKSEHQFILDMLNEHLENFKRGKTKLDMKIKYQVMDWLIRHINIVDCDYFDLKNWSENLVSASEWKEVKAIIHLTGIREVDNQHMELTELAIKLIDEIDLNPTSGASIIAMVMFQNKIKKHFAYEESVMKRFKIKNIEDHSMIHREFEIKLEEMFTNISSGTISSKELKLWILTWWINHINSVDKKTFDYNNWAYQALDESKEISDIEMILVRTGIDDIDNEHMSLMIEVLKFNNKIKKLESEGIDISNEEIKDSLISELNQIIDIAKKHFLHEEILMNDKFNIQSESHKMEHSNIIKKLQMIVSNIKEDKMMISNNIKTMILDWWINHTNIVDYNTFVTGLIDGGGKYDQ